MTDRPSSLNNTGNRAKIHHFIFLVWWIDGIWQMLTFDLTNRSLLMSFRALNTVVMSDIMGWTLMLSHCVLFPLLLNACVAPKNPGKKCDAAFLTAIKAHRCIKERGQSSAFLLLWQQLRAADLAWMLIKPSRSETGERACFSSGYVCQEMLISLEMLHRSSEQGDEGISQYP